MALNEADARTELLYRYRFAEAEYNEADASLRVDGRAVPLERRPLDVLAELLRQPGVVLTKTELVAGLWGREQGNLSDNALANAISKLREALGPAGACVKNVRGVGYRLEAHVERTVLGRQVESPLALAAGGPVPHRESYLLERTLGRPGHHSEVWLARQPRTQDARVFKFCAGGERLSALKREFTLHRLLHQSLGERPDFARVIDANFADAPYWLECEYGGIDLAEWAEQPPPFGGLAPAQRLALFLGVARSVALAHAVGVLHKDLKPGNVLVYRDAEGRWATRLTDFGSGRVLDPAALAGLGVTAMGLTVTGGVDADSGSATLFYLAPEVLAGQPPTVQSDLYALGLMLFQLLVGDFRRPMAPGWEDEIADPLLREDLAAATHSQPAARLQTVSQWTDRLERLPARRAERERQASAAAQAAQTAARWERSRARRPYVLAAFASLALGLAGSLWFYGQTRSALAQARSESQRALAINDFLNKDVLQSADVSRAGSTRQISMAEVLGRASERASERFRGQPQTEAGVRQQLAQIYQNMGSFGPAEQELSRAQALLEPLLPADDDQLRAMRLRKAGLLANRSEFKQAEAMLAAVEQGLGPQRLAGHDEIAYLAARARFAVLILQQHAQQAAPFGERALALAQALYPQELSLQATLRRELSETYNRLGQYGRATALLEVALKPPFSAASIGEASLERLRLSLARIQVAAGDNPQAEASLIQARDTLTRAFGPLDYTVAAASMELANLYSTEGRFAEARTETERAYLALKAANGAEHQATRIAAMNLALTSLHAGRDAEALRLLEDGRPWFVEKFGSERSPLVQGIDYYRAQILVNLGRPAQALALLKPLAAEALAQSSPSPDWAHRLAGQRGRALMALGRSGEGRPMLEQAVAGMEQAGTAAWIVAPMKASLRPGR
ncbi:MAG TPA: winged helix-turn-helix domain-containing protein [Ideonella sp.]|nr:winged helix-turn-helix domain-containing protein [Ideonella sp.]